MAITVEMLRKMAVVVANNAFAEASAISQTHVRTVWSAILVGFFGMLRTQIICSKSAKNFDPKTSLIRGDLKWIPNT